MTTKTLQSLPYEKLVAVRYKKWLRDNQMATLRLKVAAFDRIADQVKKDAA